MLCNVIGKYINEQIVFYALGNFHVPQMNCTLISRIYLLGMNKTILRALKIRNFFCHELFFNINIFGQF